MTPLDRVTGLEPLEGLTVREVEAERRLALLQTALAQAQAELEQAQAELGQMRSAQEVLQGMTVREVAERTFRPAARIRDLVRNHHLPVVKIWVPVPRAYPLETQILLLPPATVRRLLALTVFRVRRPRNRR